MCNALQAMTSSIHNVTVRRKEPESTSRNELVLQASEFVAGQDHQQGALRFWLECPATTQAASATQVRWLYVLTPTQNQWSWQEQHVLQLLWRQNQWGVAGDPICQQPSVSWPEQEKRNVKHIIPTINVHAVNKIWRWKPPQLQQGCGRQCAKFGMTRHVTMAQVALLAQTWRRSVHVTMPTNDVGQANKVYGNVRAHNQINSKLLHKELGSQPQQTSQQRQWASWGTNARKDLMNQS